MVVSHINNLRAQGLFNAPDTVCPRQTVHVTSNVPNAQTSYWGFCSGYLLNTPTGDNLGRTFNDDDPISTEIARDGDKFYGFVLNRQSRTFTRLDFGNSLHNTPKATYYGDMDQVLPEFPNSMYIVRDSANKAWHIFVCGGNDVASSSLARIDFAKSLSNTPNIVNFGNVNNALSTPVGLFVAKEGNNWYGYAVNRKIPNAELVRMEFGNILSLTPNQVSAGTLTGLTFPTDMAPIKDNNGLWYFFVTNALGNFIFRVDVGSSLATASSPSVTPIGNLLGQVNVPTGISIIKDCDSVHAFISNKGTNTLLRMDMASMTGPYQGVLLGNIGSMKAPTAISSLLRDRDDIFALLTNSDTTISRVDFAQCINASIPSSTTAAPPDFSYDQAGTYNMYYAVNEGMPDMQVQCKLITVLPTPSLFLSNDTTICQCDTIGLHIFSANAYSYTWSPDYHITSTTKTQVDVWPDYSIAYHLTIPFPHNCIVDTNVHIHVNKIKADAGPDRTLADGSSTILGGPLTTVGSQYVYVWSPAQFMDNPLILNPTVRPPYDYTYYLTVKDSAGCVDIDTVIVRTACNKLNLPNAFMPGSGGVKSTFGLSNMQIIKLNHFSIFDRWGREVFTTTDPTKNWDGTINGEIAQMGVYVWEADGFCVSGQRLTESGNVTLIR